MEPFFVFPDAKFDVYKKTEAGSITLPVTISSKWKKNKQQKPTDVHQQAFVGDQFDVLELAGCSSAGLISLKCWNHFVSIAHLFECDSFPGNQLLWLCTVHWLDRKMRLYEPLWMCRHSSWLHRSYNTPIYLLFDIF